MDKNEKKIGQFDEVFFDLSIDWPNDDLGIDRTFLLDQVSLSKELVLVIQGVRRSGKSTFLKQIIQHLDISPSSFYINFEDPRFADNLDHTLLDEILLYNEREKEENYYYFFDEIQNVKNWEKWLHIQIEKKKNRYFIITGSNSKLLGGKLATALTGRHRTIEVFPFSFSEFKRFFPQEQKPKEKYVHCGGFPLALVMDRPELLLRDYFTDIIERDVRANVSARSSRSLIQITKAIFESTGSELSYRKLAATFEIAVDTVIKYIEGIESSYLCLSCPYFTYSTRKSAVRPKKYYPIDVAMFQAIVTKGGANRGKILETLVFHALRRKYGAVYYWKDKHEVDFVVETEEGILPIQVTLAETKERHQLACEEFKESFPKSLPPLYITDENIERYI